LKGQVYVEVNAPLSDTSAAISLIEKTFRLNNIKQKLSITYDYEYKDSGMYYLNYKEHANRIFVNPLHTKSREEVHGANDPLEPFCPGYVTDVTLFGITLHEFSHYLHCKIYPEMILDYTKEFPTERFYINSYAGNGVFDELAEIMTLYITNPYLLRLISKKHYNFCKRYFKSPVSCSKDRLRMIYNMYPVIVKEHLQKKWGIVYNVNTDEFEGC
jgi:hypothetical protein